MGKIIINSITRMLSKSFSFNCRLFQKDAFLERVLLIVLSVVIILSGAFSMAADPTSPSSSDNSAQNDPFSEKNRKAGDRAVKVINGVEFAFRWCPPGTFVMGSPESEEGRENDETQHEVTLTNGFWIMETEVTQEQWKAIMEDNPTIFWQEDKKPVSDISWNDCQLFCQKCTQSGLSIQLPTEAQWEYACRAGTTEAYAGDIDEVGWINHFYLCAVRLKMPNRWGLYDMHGNACELCSDWYSNYPQDSVTNPEGPSSGTHRVMRGGNVLSKVSCRSANRSKCVPDFKSHILGFRCVIGKGVPSTYVPTPSTDKPKSKVTRISKFGQGTKAGERKTAILNGVEFAFRWCPPGAFKRKLNNNEYEVVITKGFWIMETEVTQEQWLTVMDKNISYYKGDKLPVGYVSWITGHEFCKKCDEAGLHIQLPTEAQWEYAFRAGTASISIDELKEISWYGSNSDTGFHSVGKRKPNAWGLYDMYDNAKEWCYDWYGDYPEENATDPTGPASGSNRVMRGGFMWSNEENCWTASREYKDPRNGELEYGFRCVISPESVPVIPDFGTGKQAGERKTCTINGVEFAFRWCPPGTFTMGSPESEEGRKNDELQHEVTLTKGFWIMESEVTHEQWQAIMKAYLYMIAPSDVKKPVVNVSWNDCQLFCQKFTKLGLKAQLPTEAQWEYACRAGTTEAFAGDVNEMGWVKNCNISPVMMKKPNNWGLYDMHGNACEWCYDWYASYSRKKATDPEGPTSGTHRIMRGGFAFRNEKFSRSANRGKSIPDFNTGGFLGFRCVIGKGVPSTYVPIKPKVNTKPKITRICNFGQGTKAGERKVAIIDGVEFAFRWCPPGTFIMGSPESEKHRYDNEPQHEVTLSKGFWMMEAEVTQEQWLLVMSDNPSPYQYRALPVHRVRWNECQDFCQKYSKIGLPIQLPTEAQWEYACRAGTTGPYAGELDDMAWYGENCEGKIHRAKEKKPNAWGLYDMHGNVFEWCEDWYGEYPVGSVTDPTGPQTGLERVVRGGGTISFGTANYCRSACRAYNSPDSIRFIPGLRCVINQND